MSQITYYLCNHCEAYCNNTDEAIEKSVCWNCGETWGNPHNVEYDRNQELRKLKKILGPGESLNVTFSHYGDIFVAIDEISMTKQTLIELLSNHDFLFDHIKQAKPSDPKYLRNLIRDGISIALITPYKYKDHVNVYGLFIESKEHADQISKRKEKRITDANWVITDKDILEAEQHYQKNPDLVN